jgi:cell wall assembly regulator SMI1
LNIGETVLDLMRQCEHNLLAHGRPFEATLSPGATADELVAAETSLGLPLPQSLRTFLATFNGMELTSYPADIHARPEGLFVYSLDELRTHSDRMYELLRTEDFAPRAPARASLIASCREGILTEKSCYAATSAMRSTISSRRLAKE